MSRHGPFLSQFSGVRHVDCRRACAIEACTVADTEGSKPASRAKTTEVSMLSHADLPVINNVREANTQGDFAYVKLAPEADGKDWAATPACISVNAAKPAACGSLLMDTGVTTMYLTVPETTFSGREVAQPRW
jgi:hypothetical protein